jgi:hypothetical protein
MSEPTLVNRCTYGNCACPITPDRVIPYVDVVGVYLDHAPSAPDLAAFDRRRYRVWRPRPQHRFRCWLIFFSQPDAATLDAIDRRHWPLCYVEFALDWLIADRAARTEAATFFHCHHIHPRSGDLRISGHSRYTRRRKSRRNVVMYADKRSKADGSSRCLHVEYRLRSAAVLRDADIHRAADLINYDHRRLWQQLLRFYDLDVEALGRHVMNRQTRDGRVRRTAQRRRSPLIYRSRSGKFSYDIDRCVGWRHLRPSGSIQQLLADLRHTRFAVPRRVLIPIPTPDCLLPEVTLCSGYVPTSDITPINPCHAPSRNPALRSRVASSPNLDIFGTASFNSWTRFAHWSSPTSTLTPVTLPPGRARLGTMPNPIGSPKPPTIGIVLVAALRSSTKKLPMAIIRSGFRLTIWRARSG